MTTDEVKAFSKAIRIEALKMVHASNSSHLGGAFSMADILAVLYGGVMNVNPKNPRWPDRDRFLLSKGHACSALYAALALRGFFDMSQLTSFAQNGSFFTSHANHHIPGVELSTGSLGHALSFGCGLALAAKRRGQAWRVFTLLSDGELDEGSNWEALLFAPHHHLNNMVVIVDHNKIQSLGHVNEVLDLGPLSEKFKSFGWYVTVTDGHDHAALSAAITKKTDDKPHIIIAETVKGKGVDFMEEKLLWHYRTPDAEQFRNALEQLEHS